MGILTPARRASEGRARAFPGNAARGVTPADVDPRLRVGPVSEVHRHSTGRRNWGGFRFLRFSRLRQPNSQEFGASLCRQARTRTNCAAKSVLIQKTISRTA